MLECREDPTPGTLHGAVTGLSSWSLLLQPVCPRRNRTGAVELQICPCPNDHAHWVVISLALQQNICPSPPQGSEGYWKRADWKVLPLPETIPHPVFEKFLYVTLKMDCVQTLAGLFFFFFWKGLDILYRSFLCGQLETQGLCNNLE